MTHPTRRQAIATLAAGAAATAWPFSAPAQARPLRFDRALSARRPARHRRPRARRAGEGQPRRRHRREPARRRRQPRRRRRRQVAARRQHDRHGRGGDACDQPLAVREDAVRPDPRLHADHRRRPGAERARDEPRGRRRGSASPASPTSSPTPGRTRASSTTARAATAAPATSPARCSRRRPASSWSTSRTPAATRRSWRCSRGQVDLNFDNLAAASANIKAGKLKALAVTTAQALERDARRADDRRGRQVARPGRFDIDTWFGIFGPAQLPGRDDAAAEQGVRRRARVAPSCRRASPACSPNRWPMAPDAVRRVREGRARQVREGRQGLRRTDRVRSRQDRFDRLDGFPRHPPFAARMTSPTPPAARGRRAPGRGAEPRDRARRDRSRGAALRRRPRPRLDRHPRGRARRLAALRLPAALRRRGQRAHLHVAGEPRRAHRRPPPAGVVLRCESAPCWSGWSASAYVAGCALADDERAGLAAGTPWSWSGRCSACSRCSPPGARPARWSPARRAALAALVLQAWRGGGLAPATLYLGPARRASICSLALMFGLTLRPGAASRWSRRWRGACTAA